MYEDEARELVASWPPLTERSNRELTTLALRHALRSKRSMVKQYCGRGVCSNHGTEGGHLRTDL